MRPPFRLLFPLTLMASASPASCSADRNPTQPPPELAPPGSAGHSLVYHDGLGAVLLVNAGLGGASAPPSSTRTTLWRWTGTRWDVVDSLGPPIRNLGGVAYDAHRDALVLFGGTYSQNLSYDDTWEWSRTGGWQRRTVAGPGTRDHTDMVYDRERHRVVLFGGQARTDSFPSDTWTWDGTTWERLPTDGPMGRVHHSLVYDAGSRRAILFGGLRPGHGSLGDTWAWTGSAWVAAANATQPRTHARLGLTAAGVILVGGIGGQSVSILRLVNGTWSPDDAAPPGARYLTSMAFDPVRNVTVLFGGGDPASDRLLADTWEYSAAAGWRLIR